ncbi:MAG TPA: hypothetical protein VFF69_16295 [Phycisphaerales bacterium]|nr:hypothetical protein [Phycisphaerales bacterium]
MTRLIARMSRALAAGGSVLLLATSGACSTNRAVSGKVLPGEAGVATVVQENDPRLEGEGLAGVELRVTDGSTGMGSIASTTTKADGSFSLKVPEAAMTRRLEVHATSEQILPFRGSTMLPMDGRKLLLFVEPVREIPARGRER